MSVADLHHPAVRCRARVPEYSRSHYVFPFLTIPVPCAVCPVPTIPVPTACPVVSVPSRRWQRVAPIPHLTSSIGADIIIPSAGIVVMQLFGCNSSRSTYNKISSGRLGTADLRSTSTIRECLHTPHTRRKQGRNKLGRCGGGWCWRLCFSALSRTKPNTPSVCTSFSCWCFFLFLARDPEINPQLGPAYGCCYAFLIKSYQYTK